MRMIPHEEMLIKAIDYFISLNLNINCKQCHLLCKDLKTNFSRDIQFVKYQTVGDYKYCL